MARVLDEVGFPPGVINVLTGDGEKPITDEKAREVLFGATQYARR